MATKRRAPLVEVSEKYELFSAWLAEQNERYAEIPPDHLQVAVRSYGAFQKSDVNRAANAERASTAGKNGDEKSSKAKTGKSKVKAKKVAAAKPADDDESEEDETPAARPAPKKSGKKGGRAAF